MRVLSSLYAHLQVRGSWAPLSRLKNDERYWTLSARECAPIPGGMPYYGLFVGVALAEREVALYSTRGSELAHGYADLLLALQQVEQDNGAFFPVSFIENRIKVFERAVSDGDSPSFFEHGLVALLLQMGAQVFYDFLGDGKGFVSKGDHPCYAPGGAYAVPVVGEFAQVDEDIAGEQGLLGNRFSAITDFLYPMIGAVASKQLVAQVLHGALFLLWLGLYYIPLCCRGGVGNIHCFTLLRQRSRLMLNYAFLINQNTPHQQSAGQRYPYWIAKGAPRRAIRCLYPDPSNGYFPHIPVHRKPYICIEIRLHH